ncbi:flagellar export protein FliJ [Candidatus Sodalis pierantonius]|uniref:flagellar export protein FliJ n=1 Tax=Candidatus Sodalis pierantonii TaxID=1486991 RepID=UPI001F0134BC|nr:flagellar export protein FliJ [Candidatus Sodalis pierantonius]
MFAAARLDQLLAYELEYRQKLQSGLARGMVSGDYENFQQFILTLETAIAQHRYTLNQWKEKVQQAIALWQDKQQRLNALSTLHSRQEQAAQVRENRLDQKKMDEFARRAADARRNNS